jgi:hypothetical protein
MPLIRSSPVAATAAADIKARHGNKAARRSLRILVSFEEVSKRGSDRAKQVTASRKDNVVELFGR